LIEDSFEKEILSGEEVRELLRDDFPAEDASPGGPVSPESPAASAALHVLLVSKRGGDTGLLRSRLEAIGAHVCAVRNPFSALDHLRSFPVDAIITELGLWAEDGALLFDRVRALGKEVPVLFLAERIRDPRGDLEERALRAGAWRVLFQPLQAGEAEEAVRALCSSGRLAAPSSVGVRDGVRPPGGLAAPSSVAARVGVRPPSSVGVRPPSSVGLTPPGDGSAEDSAEDSSVQVDGDSTDGTVGSRLKLKGMASPALEDEVRWLRLFHRSCRALRISKDRSALFKELVFLAREELEAQAAGILYHEDGRPLALFEGRKGARFQDLMTLAQLVATHPFNEAGSLKISFGERGESSGPSSPQSERNCMILLGLSPGALRAAGPVVPDIQDLLGRIG